METRRRMIIYIVAAFILGAVGGGFVGSRIDSRHDWTPRRDGPSPVKEFAARLRLDERQTQVVDSILESHRAAFDTLRKSFGMAFRAERETIRTQIKSLLDHEQRKLYDEYLKEMEERDSKRRGGGGDERSRRSH